MFKKSRKGRQQGEMARALEQHQTALEERVKADRDLDDTITEFNRTGPHRVADLLARIRTKKNGN